MAPEDALERSLSRLREELSDQHVPIEVEYPDERPLMEEIHYARYPRVHEQQAPTYGCLLYRDRSGSPSSGRHQPASMELSGLSLTEARRFADGRGSFVVRDLHGALALACFENSIEYEANLVQLARETGADIVQRTREGQVKVLAGGWVLTWDGVRWLQKPHADRVAEPVKRLVPDADHDVLIGLLEIAVHWLSPGFHGTTLVWDMGGTAVDLPRIDITASISCPSLRIDRHEHYPALLSVLSQTDGAGLIDAKGEVRLFGTMLLPSEEATETIPQVGGTRHTSARRYSYDQPQTIVVVVSEEGPVSVFSNGARVAVVRDDPTERLVPRPESAATGEEAATQCGTCSGEVVLEVTGTDTTQVVRCPACESILGDWPAGTMTLGIRKDLP